MLLAKPTHRSFAALALGVAALSAPARALAQDDRGQVDSGFALEASLGARFGLIASGTSGSFLGNSILTGMFGGYKTGRLVLGLGLEFTNFTTNTTTNTGLGGQVSVTNSDSDFLIGPEVQFALLQSPDKRVELVADLSLHFGHQFQTTSTTPAPPPNNTPTDSNFLLSYAIGPGVRYWAHHHLALQALTGFGGEAFFDIPVNDNPATGNNSAHGIFASFGALGVF